jgi:hypothetical protein
MNQNFILNSISKNIKIYIYCAVFFIFPNIAVGADTGAISIVYKLYRDYGWEALFDDTDTADAVKFLGKPIARQPKNILVHYFDNNLANLLVQDANCVENNPGEICNLDFDPIFASQDISACNLKISDNYDKTINVEYEYPSNHQKIKIIFVVKKQKTGWRISDINYGDGYSLKKILSKNK